MPLTRISYDELSHLYAKVLHPFHETDTSFDQIVNHDFESLRTGCNYYALTSNDVSFCSHDPDKLLILHINVRSLLSTEKYESLITFLHLTGIQWDIVCLSETWLNSDTERH